MVMGRAMVDEPSHAPQLGLPVAMEQERTLSAVAESA